MLALPAFFLATLVLAQDPPQAPPTIEELVAHYEAAGLKFQKGPVDGALGELAHVAVPEGSYMLDGANARKLLEMNENLTSGEELGAIWHAGKDVSESWWVFFEFSKDGYVKDDDKEIDADGLMKGMKEGNESANEERKKRGWAPLTLIGWSKPPFYDPKTHNLTWSKLLESEGRQSINWSTRLLGREGVMSVDLVLSPDKLGGALPEFESLLHGFDFTSGHKYAEFKAGDKIAEYGLAALVAGGAGALALKTGLFAKLWKLILIPILAVGAWAKRFFTGKRKPNEEPSGPSA